MKLKEILNISKGDQIAYKYMFFRLVIEGPAIIYSDGEKIWFKGNGVEHIGNW